MIHIKVISLPFVNSNILVEFQSSPQLGLVDWQAFQRRMDPSNHRIADFRSEMMKPLGNHSFILVQL